MALDHRTYPLIKIVPFLNDEEQLNYFDYQESQYQLKIYLYTDADTYTEVDWDDSDLTLVSLDSNIFITQDSGNFALLKEEGSATIAVYYDYDSNTTYYAKQEFVVYGNFFRENYLDILAPYDKNNILNTTYLTIMFDTCMEFMDIIYAYQYDMQDIRDPLHIKYKFLDVLGNSLGFGSRQTRGRITAVEAVGVRLYRELLNNLFDLLKIRGTKTAYELFFGAIGYDIELLEYWFDTEGNLIEINPEDDTESTFYATTTEGNPVDDTPVAHDDPRYLNSPNGNYNYAQKSPYIKPIFSYKEGYAGIITYSSGERLLLREYLELLRPNHIEYLSEIITILLPEDPNVPGAETDIIDMLYDNSSSITLVNLLQPYAYYDTVIKDVSFATVSGTNWTDLTNIEEEDIEYASYALSAGTTSDEINFSNGYNYDNSSVIKSVIGNIKAHLDIDTSILPIEVGATIEGFSIVGDETDIILNPINVGVSVLSKTDKKITIDGKLTLSQTSVPMRVEIDAIEVGALPELISILGDEETVLVNPLEVEISFEELSVYGNNTIVKIVPMEIEASIYSAFVSVWETIVEEDDWDYDNWNDFVWNMTDSLSSWLWDDINRISIELRAVNDDYISHEVQVAWFDLDIYGAANEMTIDLRPYHIDNTTGITSRLDYDYTDGYTDLAGVSYPADPGRLDYDSVVRNGVWQGTGGGFVVETLVVFNETFILSLPVPITDIIQTLPKFDSNLYYDGYVYDNDTDSITPAQPSGENVPPESWDDSLWMPGGVYGLPTSIDLKWDTGTMLEETYPSVISVEDFQEQYQTYSSQGYSSAEIETMMLSLFPVTDTQYTYLISLT